MRTGGTEGTTMNSTTTTVRATAIAAVSMIITAGAVAPAHAAGQGSQQGDQHRADQASTAGDHGRHLGQQKQHGTNGTTPSKGSKQNAHGHGHTPVTVCHLLGNGGYHLLTMDDNALKAHLGHGDLYPVPADGCPAPTAPESESPETSGTPAAPEQPATPEDTAPEVPTVPTEPSTELLTPVPGDSTGEGTTTEVRGPVVLGVEAIRDGSTPARTAPGAARVAPVAGPATGLLPNTGAGELMLPLLGGLGLVAAGAGLVARRRTQPQG